jgi:hypothetical protein
MIFMKKAISILSILLLTCSSISAQISEKDVVKNGSFSTKKFKKAPKKIFINSFNVYFQVFGSASAKTTGGESFGTLKGNTNVAMGIGIDGVDNADFIEITTNVYNKYIEDLTSLGYEIVSADEASEIDELKNWTRKKGATINAAQSKGFVKVTPSGYDYFVKRETSKGKEKTGMFGNQGVISKQLNDAVIVDVNFTFYFVAMKTYSNEFLGYSQVSGKPNFHFARALGDVNNQVLSGVNYVFGKNFTSTEAAISCTLKKAVYSDKPVIDSKEKIKESAVASSVTIPDYAAIIFIENVKLKASHTLTVNKAYYMSETERMMNEFIAISLKRLQDNSN